MRVLLDTSVLIAFFDSTDEHHDVAAAALNSDSDTFEISVISYMEMLVWPARKSVREVDRVKRTLRDFASVIHPVDEEIAVLAAMARGKSRAADALISATASARGTGLWTLDQDLARAHKGSKLLK
ncbi:MAG: PIN domain-containing protein [Actinobacteria bacterium]|nr:PIN domain-containing protein [Actinomycetota bacterium]